MPITAMPSGLDFVLVVAAYLLGSLSPGWALVRMRSGTDLREAGSGVTGATNAARVLGKGGYALVLFLDALKGYVAVKLAAFYAPHDPWAALAGPAVIAGHIWPIFLNFRGGRGAGTFMGVCIALDWRIVAWAWIPGLVVGLIVRKGFAARSVAFLCSLGFGLYLLSVSAGGAGPYEGHYAQLCLVLSWTLVLLAHRSYFVKHVPG